MFAGVLTLGALAVTELRIRATAQGVAIEAEGLLKNPNGIGPPEQVSFRRATTWPEEVVRQVTQLVELVERTVGESLGPGGTTQSLPPSDIEPKESGDLATALSEDQLPRQL